MYVCHCRAVTDRRICEAIEAGACGGCLPAVRALLAHYGQAGQVSGNADSAAA